MSQGSTVLPTTGVFSGLTEQGSINAALAALLSNNSGGSAPASPTQYQLWADTSVSGQVTIRQYVATVWEPLWVVDTNDGRINFAQNTAQNWIAASGTHDAITATYDPPVTALVDGMVLAFRATSASLTTAPTFNPNGLGAVTITKNGGQALAIGDIPGVNAEITLRYNGGGNWWTLVNAPDVPVGGIVPYFGGSIPSGFALPQGQNLSATTYPAANAVLGTTYGNPGGGNFTMPDLRGRTMASLDAGGSNRLSSQMASTTLGATGGSAQVAITQVMLPNVNFAISGITLSDPGHTHSVGGSGSASNNTGGAFGFPFVNQNINSTNTTGVTIASQGNASSGGSGSPLPTLQPTMVVNCIMRIG